MKIVFKELILHDFKGLRDFTLTFDDKLTQLYGANGVGKTTIVHSLFWLFFGKDAFGSSKFELKPLDENNNEIPDTAPTVTLKFTHGAKDNVYTRSKEDSKTTYTINGANVTATEFKRHVGSVVTEELFSALLSPTYFGDNYSWQKQRDTILNNMKFENTIIDDFEFDDVAEKILEEGVEQTLSYYDKQRKSLEKSKLEYKGTMDYLGNKLKDVDTSITEEELVKQKELKQKEIKDSEKVLDSLHPIQSEISTLERKIHDLENENSKAVRDKESEIQTIKNSIAMELMTKKNDIKSKISKLKQDIEYETKSEKNRITTIVNSLKKEKDILVNTYKEKVKELNLVKDTCSLCGSKLDEFEIENQRAILQEKIEEIKLQGKTKAEELKAAESDLANVKDDEEKLKEIELLQSELDLLKEDELKTEEINVLMSEIEKLKSLEVATDEKNQRLLLVDKVNDINSKVDYDKIQILRDELSGIEKQVREYESTVKDKFDLDRVIQKSREIMGEYDECEEIIDAIKQYRTDYAQMIADNLNAKLDRVKIKTFELDKNGEPKDVFEVSMDGVPYASLNSAGKIEAGVELINILAESLSIIFPVVIDNKESITKDFDLQNQLITLSVLDMKKYIGLDSYKPIAFKEDIEKMEVEWLEKEKLKLMTKERVD